MRNNITFTGINILSVGQKTETKSGSYITSNGNIKQGEKSYAEYKIKCKLTDDEFGHDLTDFKNSLTKSHKSYQAQCVEQASSDEIDFRIKRCSVNDEVENITNSNFEINGISVLPNDRNILPLFSFLAKLTRNMAKLPDMSEARRNIFRISNQSIQEEAVKFIDNMECSPIQQ